MILDQDKRFYFFLQTIWYKAWKVINNKSQEVVKLSFFMEIKNNVFFRFQ